MEEGSADFSKTASEQPSASGEILGSHNHENLGDTTLWPRKNPNDQSRPSPVPSSDARVRWAMMASLAGVRKSSTSEGSPNPDVRLSHGGRQPSSGIQEDRNHMSKSHESKRPKTTLLGPHIPIRSQSGSMHERKSSDVRAKPSFLQEKPDTLLNNPTSIEQYLKNISNDPNIDDRGLRDGLQSLMLGSGDSNGKLGEFISGDSKNPTENKKITRTPDAKKPSESNASPALTNRVTQGHDEPNYNTKTPKAPDMPVLSGNSYHPSALHQQEWSPSDIQSVKGSAKDSSLNPSAQTKTSGGEKDNRQSKPSAHLLDHNTNQHHQISPELAPHEGYHNTSARSQPNPNPISATHFAQAHTNIQQESRLTLPNNTTGHEKGNASLQSKANDNRPALQQSQTSVLSFPGNSPPNLVRPQSTASQSFSRPLPAIVQHANHNDSAVPAPATSSYAPVQPLPTPPQTPGLSGAPSHNQKESNQENPQVSKPLDVGSPTNPASQREPRSVGSATDSRTSMTHSKETGLLQLQPIESAKDLKPSLPEPFQQPRILHPPFSLPNNEINRQSPAAILRAQITREREEKRQSKQQEISLEPKVPGSSTKIQSDIAQQDFPKSSHPQRQGRSPPKLSNASGNAHQSSQLPQAARNIVSAEHSPSPAAAIRAQVAEERAARLQAQEEPKQYQKQHSRPSSDPLVSGPQAMLNLVKDKAKASVDAAAGNPGFLDREFLSLHFLAHSFTDEMCWATQK